MSDFALYGTILSGHTWRVAALLRMLGLPFRFIDSPATVRRSASFRELNPFGQVPVLKDGELVLADSNAILVYLAKRYGEGTPWLPEDPVTAWQVQRWLSIAAGEIRYGPGEARLIVLWNAPGSLEKAHEISERLLRFMDGHLANRRFLAAPHATIADISCYPYVAHAPEGHIDLGPYPAVRAWIARVEELPGFEPMPKSAIPEKR